MTQLPHFGELVARLARHRQVMLPGLAGDVTGLSPKRRRRLRQLVRSLPQEDRTQPVPALRVYEGFDRGPGGVLLRMIGTSSSTSRPHSVSPPKPCQSSPRNPAAADAARAVARD